MREIVNDDFGKILLNPKLYIPTKARYLDFSEWCNRKISGHERAEYVYNRKNEIIGFMYLKPERYSEYSDIQFNTDVFNNNKVLKIGCLLTDGKEKRVGYRLLHEAEVIARNASIEFLYGTVFQEYTGVIQLLKKQGFIFAGKKKTVSGLEDVYIKKLQLQTDIILISNAQNKLASILQ